MLPSCADDVVLDDVPFLANIIDVRFTPLAGAAFPVDITAIDDAYLLWRSAWRQETDKLGLPPLAIEEFLRQHYLASFYIDDRLAGLHFYSIYDLRLSAVRDTRYIREFLSAEDLKRLMRLKIHRLMAAELLVVHPAFRKQAARLRLAEFMIGTAVLASEAVACDALLGAARTDVGVDAMALKFVGMERLGKAQFSRNTPIQTVIRRTQQHAFGHHQSPALEALVKAVWCKQKFFSNVLQEP